ncbi:MAG: ABC transporter permease subunit [Eubacteriales bacterium]|nr:ABC transporter permease subunit [Eubacteriales bacterium]
MKKAAGIIKNACVLLFWLAVWQTAALIIGRELLIPSPLKVALQLAEFAVSGEFWVMIFVSLMRVMGGFLLGVVSGILTAALAFRFRVIHALIAPLLTVIRVTPVASFIILALVWMSSGFVPIFIAFLIVLPIVWSGVTAGLESVDRSLAETAFMYNFTRHKLLTKLYIPSVMPFFKTSVINAIGFAWKTGVAAEVLCVPAFSIGKQIYEAKLYLETVDLFAWTAALIVISLIIENILKIAMRMTEIKY